MTNICTANSPEFWKKPSGPIKPQSVNAKPRMAQVLAPKAD